jgi:hypothetical protein
VPYPGWDAQAQALPGGSLSRHKLFGRAASAPAVGGSGGGRGKLTVWGQRMSRVRRKPSVRSSAAPVSVPLERQRRLQRR